MFYCPHCKKIEVNEEKSYGEKDIIFNNSRDGYGLMLHYVICKECEYPLSAVVKDYKIKERELDGIWYWQTIITNYQDGTFASKNNMLKLIKQKYETSDRWNKQQVINACNKFLEV
jgi:hypothetical protein